MTANRSGVACGLSRSARVQGARAAVGAPGRSWYRASRRRTSDYALRRCGRVGAPRVCARGGARGPGHRPAGRPGALRFVPASWHLEEDQQIVERFQAEQPRISVRVEPVTGMSTAGATVTTQTKHPDEACRAAGRLTKYFVSPPAQRNYAATYAAAPVLQSMRNDSSWRGLPPPPANHEAFVKAADSGTLPPEVPLDCGSVYTQWHPGRYYRGGTCPEGRGGADQ